MHACCPAALHASACLQAKILQEILIDRQGSSPSSRHACCPALHASAWLQAKILQEIRIDRLDLGTRPPRVDCFKSFETAEDELIIEVSGPVDL